MGLLKKAVREQSYAKIGVYGPQGSGKTFTSTMLAIAVAKLFGKGKPVAWQDTETGSDFVLDCFETEGVELLRLKSRAFTDLLRVMREAERDCCMLLVDSVTHVWRELCESYCRERKIKKPEFQHWNEIKGEKMWGQWTNWVVNSPTHVLISGRSGYEYEYQESESEVNRDGSPKKELIKGDTKMKVEGEFGYEPSMLVRMGRGSKTIVDAKKKTRGGWTHDAVIEKDRTRRLNGLTLSFEGAEGEYKKGDWEKVAKPFMPFFEWYMAGNGNHVGFDETRNSQDMIGGPGSDWKRKRTVALEQVQGSITAIWPGQDAKSKACKAEVVNAVFGTRSWSAVEDRSVEELERAVRVFSVLEGTAKDAEVEGVAGLVADALNKITSVTTENE